MKSAKKCLGWLANAMVKCRPGYDELIEMSRPTGEVSYGKINKATSTKKRIESHRRFNSLR